MAVSDLPLRDQFMPDCGMAEHVAGQPLEPLLITACLSPYQQLQQVDHLVLHDPLQRLQPVRAGKPRHRHRSLFRSERLKEQPGRYRQLVLEHGPGAFLRGHSPLPPVGLAAGAAQPRGDPERQAALPFPAQQPLEQPVEEHLVVEVKQALDVLVADHTEAAFADVARLAQSRLVDGVCLSADHLGPVLQPRDLFLDLRHLDDRPS